MLNELNEIYELLEKTRISVNDALDKLHRWSKKQNVALPEYLSFEILGFHDLTEDEIPSSRKLPLNFLHNEQRRPIILFQFSPRDLTAKKMIENIRIPITAPFAVLVQNLVPNEGLTIDVTTKALELIQIMDETIPGGQIVELPGKVYLRVMYTIVERIEKDIKDEIFQFIISKLKENEYSFDKSEVTYDDDLMTMIPSGAISKQLGEAWECYSAERYEAGVIMLRKALDISLHIGMKIKYSNDDLLKDTASGNYFNLPKKIDIVRGNGLVSQSLADSIKNTTKLLGDIAAHDHTITITKDHFENSNKILSLFLEHFFTKIRE